jgi:hypothetical protein
MQLNKVDHIIESLKEKDKNIIYEQFTCWEFKEKDYSLYIFSIQLKNQVKLLEIHEDLRDYIAIYFQSQLLEKDVERWNIYQFFFIEENVDHTTKQKIEQDKFSTRKIIHDGLQKKLSDDEIKILINQELFDFKIEKRPISKVSIESFLSQDHSLVLSLIDEIGNNKMNDSLEHILKSLGNE